MKVTIKIATIKEIQTFVRKASAIKGDIDLVQGKYRVPATSLMSVFALDLDKPVKIEFDDRIKEVVFNEFDEFILGDKE